MLSLRRFFLTSLSHIFTFEFIYSFLNKFIYSFHAGLELITITLPFFQILGLWSIPPWPLFHIKTHQHDSFQFLYYSISVALWLPLYFPILCPPLTSIFLSVLQCHPSVALSLESCPLSGTLPVCSCSRTALDLQEFLLVNTLEFTAGRFLAIRIVFHSVSLGWRNVCITVCHAANTRTVSEVVTCPWQRLTAAFCLPSFTTQRADTMTQDPKPLLNVRAICQGDRGWKKLIS